MGVLNFSTYLKLEMLKNFSLVLVLLLITISATTGDSFKNGKRYRSKLVSKSDSSIITAPLEFNNETSDVVYYPSPTISSSRTMDVSGTREFEPDREEETLVPFNNNMDPWGNHRMSAGSSSATKYAQSQSNSHAMPTVSQRYSSAEKYGSGGNHFGGGVSNPIYSSYPLGGTGSFGNLPNYYPNPILDTYPYYEREQREKERAARELLLTAAAANKLKTLSALNTLGVGLNPAMAAAASTLLGSAVAPPPGSDFGDALALASGGHGWGWKDDHDHEHKHEHKHDNNDLNTNALGLLGLLGLLSILSNILFLLTTTTTTTTTAAGRKKRSIGDEEVEETAAEKTQRIFSQVLPYLTPVAHARSGVIPTECTLQGICLTNKLMVKEYGFAGRPAGNRVTSAIADLIGQIKTEQVHKKKIEKAGLHGRNQRNCEKVYPICKAIQIRGHYSIPFLIQTEDVPQLFEKFKKLSDAHSSMQL